jgi:hypothetical protein
VGGKSDLPIRTHTKTVSTSLSLSHALPTFPSTEVEELGAQAAVFVKTLRRWSCFNFWAGSSSGDFGV